MMAPQKFLMVNVVHQFTPGERGGLQKLALETLELRCASSSHLKL